jgi:TRAP-type C4-dicarboxylate transport system substrate-binding protein
MHTVHLAYHFQLLVKPITNERRKEDTEESHTKRIGGSVLSSFTQHKRRFHMKNKRIVILVGGICLALMLVAHSIAPGHAAANQTIRLKFANYFPPASVVSKICEEFITDIEKRTNGRVKITYYKGGSLLKGNAMFMGVVEGATDIGLSHIIYTPGRMPVTEVCSMPLGYPNPWVSVHVVNDFCDRFKPKEWNGVHVLWMHTSGVTILMTKMPVRRLEDLKGMIIRAPGQSGKTIRALGGTPAPTLMSEVYDALSKGVIHGAYTGVMGLKDWRFAEVVDYTTLSWEVGAVYPMYVVMNKGSWNKLPADIQEIFNKASEEYKEKFATMWNMSEVRGKEYGMEHNVEFINLSQQEAARWRQAVSPVIDEYEKDMVAKGFAKNEIRNWIDFLQERIDYWTKKQAELGIKSATGPAEITQ